MSLIENFIRRVEKLIPSYPTIPLPGTNHIDDDWITTDLYPGEMGINLSEGGLYTSDGEKIIELNTEDVISSGMILQKDTSGVNKLTVTSGSIRIKGVTYFHYSSGTDILLPINIGASPILYFIYAEPGAPTGSSGPSVILSHTSFSGKLKEPDAIYSSISETQDIPLAPNDSILLGTVLVPVGASGFDLFPLTLTEIGDYYPKFSLTPSEFLRTITSENSVYKHLKLYFPDQLVIDNLSDTLYLSKQIFISDPSTIDNDVALGYLVQLSGFSGGTAGYSSASVGTAPIEVYQTTVANQFRFRTIRGSGIVQIGYTGIGNTEIQIGLSSSGFISALTNIGAGATIYAGLTSSTIAQLRSLTAGSNVSISTIGDTISISVPSIGSSAEGINLGTGGSADVYAGMSGSDLTFRRLNFGVGISASQGTNEITIDATGRNNQGVNVGNGPGFIYGGMSGDNLIFRSITGSTGVSVSLVGNSIIISASGSSATNGINIGSTGSTVGQPFAGMSGSDLAFRSITTGYGLAITNIGNNIQLDSVITSGVQGPIGLTGFQGSRGFQGSMGFQGIMGPTGINGANGPQGFQGPGNLPGATGAVGPQGPTGADLTPSATQTVEVYDNSAGWILSPLSQIIIPFNVTRHSSPIYTVNQILPTGSGTELSSSQPGSYLFLFTITAEVNSTALTPSQAYFSLWNNTTSTEVPGTRVYMLDDSTVKISVSSKAIIDNYVAGHKYVIKGYYNVVGSETITAINSGSSFSMIKLDGIKGNTGPQGPVNTTPSISANNGLSLTGSTVQLGGSLLKDTTIDTLQYSLSLIKNNPPISTNSNIGLSISIGNAQNQTLYNLINQLNLGFYTTQTKSYLVHNNYMELGLPRTNWNNTIINQYIGIRDSGAPDIGASTTRKVINLVACSAYDTIAGVVPAVSKMVDIFAGYRRPAANPQDRYFEERINILVNQLPAAELIPRSAAIYIAPGGYDVYANTFTVPEGYWGIYQASEADNLFNGKIILKNVPTYDNEADATTAGLPEGAVYKTTTGELRIKL